MSNCISFLKKMVLVCLCIIINKQPLTSQLSPNKELDLLFSKFVEAKDFSGSILIANEGEIIYKNAFGLADKQWNIRNKSNTKHRLASKTKQFTAMLTMQLVAEGLLALDKPISTYLANYPKQNGDQITIHHLLTHTSGIPNYTSFPSYQTLMKTKKSPLELIDIFKDSTLQFNPGDQFNYSNSGYVLLGFIMEKITGKPYAQLLKEKIFEPLKMKNTGIENTEEIINNMSSGYFKNGRKYSKASYIDLSVAYSAGSIYSTVEDLFLWDQALYTNKLLPQKYKELIFDKHIPAWGQHYGYGWLCGEMKIGNTKEKIQITEHSGDINGYKSLITRIPNKKASIILLSNVSGAPLFEMANAVTGILYEKTYDNPKKSLASLTINKIEEEGISAGISFFQKNKKLNDYEVNENEINAFGYELLQEERTKDALLLFNLNVELFPGSSNVYDSYAEAHMILGNKDKAIENYQKSIELNPRNSHGKKMLEKLGVDSNDIVKRYFYFLESDSSWRKEIFHFPIHFAKDIDHEGLEDARFPREWAVPQSDNFWSYVFAWRIERDSCLSKSELEDGLQKYFNGLMRIEDRVENDGVKKTTVKVWKTKNTNDISHFSGKVETLEAFFTLKAMTLNVKIEQHLAKHDNELVIIYRFSPKSFEHNVWENLNEVRYSRN